MKTPGFPFWRARLPIGRLLDFNRDGVVDSGDLAGWASGFGDGDAYDANGDGSSDGADFLIWQQQQGTSSFLGAAQPAATAVPEPTCGCWRLLAWRLAPPIVRFGAVDSEDVRIGRL